MGIEHIMGNTKTINSKLNNKLQVDQPAYGGKCYLSTDGNWIYQKISTLDKDAQILINFIQDRIKLQHPNLITVYQYNLQSIKDYCSLHEIYFIEMAYHYSCISLQKYIGQYSLKRKFIPYNQVIYIFRSILKCLYYLQQNGTCHGDVKPSTILLHQQTVKLVDSFFVHGGRISFEIVMSNPSSRSLLSPEQLSLLKNRQSCSLQNVHQNEIFSLGLTMLEVVTMQPAMQCYDLNQLQIKQNYIQNKQQNILSYGYPLLLVNLIMDCCKLKSIGNRPTFLQCLKRLQKM